MKLKIKLLIFLVICAMLILAIILAYNTHEGFISYNKTMPALNQVYISQYSMNNYLYKVHDSVYFDSANGNIIELFGVPFSETITDDKTTNLVDTIGSSLTDIILMTRSRTQNAPLTITHHVKTNGQLSVNSSLLDKTVTNSYKYTIIPDSTNYNAYSKITYNYQVLYIPVGNDTIVHLYDCSNKSNVNVGTYLFRKNQSPTFCMYKGGLPSNLGNFIHNNVSHDDGFYDPEKISKMCRISATVSFDITNHHLILGKNGGITVFNGTLGNDGKPKEIYSNISERGIIKNTTNYYQEDDFTTFEVLYILDTHSNSCVLYIPFPSSKKTVVAIISMDSNVLGLITIRNVVVFNQSSPSGIEFNDADIIKPQIEDDKVIQVSSEFTNKLTKCSLSEDENCKNENGKNKIKNENTKNENTKDEPPTLDSIISNYYSKYYNNNSPPQLVNGVKHYSTDFLLKTQVIPPICPACPTMTNNATCSNCGGNGGSGMYNTSTATTPSTTTTTPSTTYTPSTTTTIPSTTTTTPSTTTASSTTYSPSKPSMSSTTSTTSTTFTPFKPSTTYVPTSEKLNRLPIQNDTAVRNTGTSEFLPLQPDLSGFV